MQTYEPLTDEQVAEQKKNPDPQPRNKLESMTLQQLVRLKERWAKATVKDETKREKAIQVIDLQIARRIVIPRHCALPKKMQRKLGILPPVANRCPYHQCAEGTNAVTSNQCLLQEDHEGEHQY